MGFNPSIERLLMQASHLVFVVVTLSPKFQSLDWEIILSSDERSLAADGEGDSLLDKA
jgi:hypothetical protein